MCSLTLKTSFHYLKLFKYELDEIYRVMLNKYLIYCIILGIYFI